MKTILAKDVYGKKHRVPADSLRLSVHVYGIAVSGDKALIVPQFDGYDWPGGTLEIGEDHLDTLRREFREETGLEVEPQGLLGIYTSFFHHLKRNENYQSLLVFYAVKITRGSISTDGFDEDEKEYAQKAQWVNIGDLPEMRHACSIEIAAELIGFAKKLSEPK